MHSSHSNTPLWVQHTIWIKKIKKSKRNQESTPPDFLIHHSASKNKLVVVILLFSFFNKTLSHAPPWVAIGSGGSPPFSFFPSLSSSLSSPFSSRNPLHWWLHVCPTLLLLCCMFHTAATLQVQFSLFGTLCSEKFPWSSSWHHSSITTPQLSSQFPLQYHGSAAISFCSNLLLT